MVHHLQRPPCTGPPPFRAARRDSFLSSPELTVSDLRELAAPGIVPESLRKYLQAEVQRRLRAGEKTASGSAPAKALLRQSGVSIGFSIRKIHMSPA